MVMGSGNLTHKLEHFREHAIDDPSYDWVRPFSDWMADAIDGDQRDDILDYRKQAPHAEPNHPEDDHLLPFFVAHRAGGRGARVHTSKHLRNAKDGRLCLRLNGSSLRWSGC